MSTEVNCTAFGPYSGLPPVQQAAARDMTRVNLCQHTRYATLGLLARYKLRKHSISTSLPIICPDTIDTTLFVSHMTTLAA